MGRAAGTLDRTPLLVCSPQSPCLTLFSPFRPEPDHVVLNIVHFYVYYSYTPFSLVPEWRAAFGLSVWPVPQGSSGFQFSMEDKCHVQDHHHDL